MLCVTHRRRRGGCETEKQAMLLLGKVPDAVSKPLPLRKWYGMVERVQTLEA